MAPKAKAPAKAAKATVATAKPKGLQLTTAQWKAYGAAYSAFAKAAYANLAAQHRQAALNAAALNIRKSRLQAAASMLKKTAVAHQKARTAAIAAFAARMSLQQARNAHQNRALVARVQASTERHLQVARRTQYVYKGEKAFAHEAVMRTVTSAQAMTLAQSQFSKAIKAAKAGVTSTRTSSAASQAANAAIVAGARAAGLAAAMALPGPPSRAALSAAAKTRAKAQQQARAATAKSTAKGVHKVAKGAKKKTVPKARTAPRPPSRYPVAMDGPLWRGDPDGYDCVAAAIANAYHFDTGLTFTDRQYKMLVTGIGAAPSLEFALWETARMGEAGMLPRLVSAVPDDPALLAGGNVIGFTTAQGEHAAVYFASGLVVSWSEVYYKADLGTRTEESWDLQWAGA